MTLGGHLTFLGLLGIVLNIPVLGWIVIKTKEEMLVKACIDWNAWAKLILRIHLEMRLLP